ncbi:inositol monophosphatase [Pseudonocardia dioxanivorans CB1190]|uniref:inositol-phosphate phosphatase n=1 Tax=Pseudonocardia dioxanivorans (strain ATCC 55486 / DSM 44775 / JCM 13855 / CB1190) TaxID=675635 RepID=F4CYX8_PSEUX|nr:inositol monophosphatase family protein [Pseudonocardia dioxanivorans]AEA27703.1 inositol monophosphatase [Pseudonocardia dioxanivorans CB1190]GJF05474.1 Myo-inositol-monophosphatase [Pseudonocardia sp. D17]
MTVLPRPDAAAHRMPVPAPVEPGLLSRALEVAGRLANDAAEVIAATAGRSVAGGLPPGATSKADPFDWVTDTDRTLERHTRRVLAAEFPGVPVVGEEYGRDAGAADAALRWVVDPVDGTANFVAGFPWCAYSLALVDHDGPVVGVVADPGRSRLYAAARGRGVRANGVAVRVCDRDDAAGGLVCAEPPTDTLLRAARAGHAGVRVLGSSALAITQVAGGQAVAAVLQGYQEWDVAGALALALAAGAVVVDVDGRPDPMPADGMVVAAPGVVGQVLGWWRG